MMAAKTRRFDFENGRCVQANNTVAFRTQASTHFVPGELTSNSSLSPCVVVIRRNKHRCN